MAQRLIVWSGLAILILWWIDDDRTLLITPVPGYWIMVAVGLVAGVAFARALIAWLASREHRDGRSKHPIARAVSLYLICAAWFMVVFAHGVGRIAEAAAFWGSRAPIATVPFPIMAFRSDRAGPRVDIGNARDLAVTGADARLLSVKALGPPWRYCLPLRRQEARGAVRIFKPRRLPSALTKPGMTIRRCPPGIAGSLH